MTRKFIDKVEDVSWQLQQIQSAVITLREALSYSLSDCSVFSGAANLIAADIGVAADELGRLTEEMIHA